jgi:hypothetical protein
VTAQAWESTNPNASLYGNTSAFVTEINPYGTQLLLSTYVGPPAQALSNGSNGNIQGAAIALDSEDNIYITGNANTNAFPGTPGAYEPAISGYPGAFVVKLRSTGSSLAYSTFIDGDLGSVGNGIAVDSSGSAYITGWANDGFPVTPGAAQSVNNGEFNANNENPNAFVSKLDPTGSVLVYSTYLGGQGQVDQNPEDSEGFGDIGNGIAVDSFGHAWVTGYTYSTDFPVTRCAYQTTNRTNNLEFTAFLTEVSPDGTAFDYSTYFGGNGGENGKAIAVDGENSIYFAGYTSSTNFPLLNPYQNKNKEVFGSIAFVTKFAQPRRPILCRILKRPTEGR